jgi:predicted AlkP superfamily phosphohydrolase/phosphomutase
VLVFLNFDSVSLPLLEKLVDEGRLPAVAELFRRGRRYTLDTPAEHFPAASYFVLYSGRELADHGLYYTFLWSPPDQRVRFIDSSSVPQSAWERASAAGARVLVIDPYQAAVPQQLNGFCIAGWQFRNRVVLPGWSRPRPALRHFGRRFGSAPSVDEVFGTQSLSMLRTTRRHLLAAPARVSELCRHLLARESFDLLWLTFSAAHLAGHQFWDLSQLDASDVEAAKSERLHETLAHVYGQVDTAIAEILEAVPDDADIVLFSVLGMGASTSRVDLLPRMLQAVLSEERTEAADVPGSFLWRIRGAVPTRLRATVAQALPRRAVLELTARLETRGIDWRTVRAFALPSDTVGYIRLNLRGRERNGTVEPRDAEALVEEIVRGLSSFNDQDGAPSIAAVERVSDVVPDSVNATVLPDLVVRWSDRPATQLDHVVSERFGEVRRVGHATGRSGNHTGDAWAVVVSRAAGGRDDGRARVADLPATVCATFGAETGDLAGESLLGRT